MAVIDCFTFNGENAVLKLHLGVMYDYVDKFIIVEANKTFTGEPKPMYFFRDQHYFKQWHKKIEYYQVTQWDDVNLWEMAIQSPNTVGAEHWKREFYIKESIRKALSHAKVHDDDTVFIGDVDEIIDPLATFESDTPVKAKLRVYAYHLNNRSNEEFYGTLIAQYKDIKDKCLNHVRSDKSLNSKGPYLGWHFTSMGGVEEVRRKLNASYTNESYNTYEVQQLLQERIKQGTDYLGRNFQFTLDESEWPQYLKDNKKHYANMCRTIS
jgi:beta-1,4-mannosyl-glycoprotein beta-1,4-N-acetylglucosaminyltransferase